MINAVVKNNYIKEFVSSANSMFDTLKANYDLSEAMVANNVDNVHTIVRKVQSIMLASIPDGLSVPKTSLYVSLVGRDDYISLVNVTFTNKLSDSRKFKYTISITKDKASQKVFDFMISVYTTLITDELVNINLQKINDVLSQAVAESGLDYGVKIVSSLGNEGSKIASMSDDEIVFVADEDRVFSLDNVIVLFDEATEAVSEENIQKHFDSIVEELSTAQTPEQLVGIHGGALISHVCDISKRLKAMTLIKKVCNKNATKLRGDKDTKAYFADGDVFALVARREGAFEVILSPFDVNTLRKVDYDVLKAIG